MSGLLPDETLISAVVAFKESGGNKRAAARALRIDRTTLDNRLRHAAARGLMGFSPVLEGFRITKETDVQDADGNVERRFIQQKPEPGGEFRVPDGHQIKGVSALIDGDGRELIKWVKTKEGALDPLHLADLLKSSFEGFAPAVRIVPSPSYVNDDILTFFPLADWHLGMYAWHEETDENWDLKIAESTLSAAMDSLIERTPSSGTAVILGGGDFFHSDTNDNVTARSKNPLQVDGRYQKVVLTGCRVAVRIGERALERHGRLIYRFIPGNHDEHAYLAVAYFLHAWFRNDPRVTVDLEPSAFWWHRFGKVLLGATHGHTVKIQNMPQIMAHRRAEDWGATKYRYVHGFHLHHAEKIATEGGGCICEVHQAPIPQDAWNFNSGFLSGRSVQAIQYHREFGEIGRDRVAIMDGSRDATNPQAPRSPSKPDAKASRASKTLARRARGRRASRSRAKSR